MKECNCEKTEQITKMETKLDAVYDEVMGKEGLAKSSIRLEESVSTLSNVVDKLGTCVRGVMDFQMTTEATISENARHKQNRKWFITTIIASFALLITALGVIVATR